MKFQIWTKWGEWQSTAASEAEAVYEACQFVIDKGIGQPIRQEHYEVHQLSH